ncbi:MAG TPA: 30S ribosomal protein S6 [Planctomycetota bacterium]|nr:30S ribosomal protein S6 [Planctomycetota bacterium]
MKLYEGMFLLDNQVVRADWNAAKAVVTGVLTKHGADVKTARRWDERRLAYPIKGRKRATYLLAYFEQDGAGTQQVRRDLEIDERVLRYLIIGVEELPEGELEKSQAELEAGFTIPPMPGDDEVVEETVEIDESAADQAEEIGDPDDDDSSDDDGKKED